MSTETTKKPGSGRRDLFLILGMLIAVIATSTALYWAATNGRVNLPALLGTKNNGDLITPPRSFGELSLQKLDGQAFVFSMEKPRWSLLIPVSNHCDARCEQTLHLTRQMHVALGKNASRVQRYLISKDGAPDVAFEKLLTQHAGVKVLLAEPTVYQKLFDGFDPIAHQQYFVVDPAGWMMMAYGPQHGGQSVMTDLKFLLSNSHEDEPSSGDGK